MKKLFPVLLILSLCLFASCDAKKETTVTELNTPAEKLGYALGSDIGKSFKTNEMVVDMAAFVQGFKDSLNDNKPLLTPDEIKVIQKEAITEMKQKIAAKQKETAAKNLKDGEKFLAENSEKEGVVVTKSGLQYKILTKGDGPIPLPTDKVKVNYVGTLLDGTEFDSSVKRGTPAEFRVTGVIAGWTEALKLMPTGSKWQIFVPSKLAYGPRGAGKQIGANATLIFEVELLEIVTKKVAEIAPKKADEKAKK